jgi:hypothetical protein
VVCDDQPFTVIEGTNLRKLLRLLNPTMVVPSADTIRNDLLESFKKERDLMRKTLQVYELLNLFTFKKLAVAYKLIILTKLRNF